MAPADCASAGAMPKTSPNRAKAENREMLRMGWLLDEPTHESRVRSFALLQPREARPATVLVRLSTGPAVSLAERAKKRAAHVIGVRRFDPIKPCPPKARLFGKRFSV